MEVGGRNLSGVDRLKILTSFTLLRLSPVGADPRRPSGIARGVQSLLWFPTKP